jgi:UDP-2,4-diacetamido-2,4,6-trideoxy-beta-L-altropyranose hydrolase
MRPDPKEVDALTVLLRADTSAQLGLGHGMRCLALAQALRRRQHMVLFAGQADASFASRLGKAGVRVVADSLPNGLDADARLTRRLADEFQADWIVCDGYRFTDRFQRSLMPSRGGNRPQVLCIDDPGQIHFDSDLVLNQNRHATDLTYSRAPRTDLLLGTEYVLLREEFLPFETWRRPDRSPGTKVLVTLGGGDVDNQTAKSLRALGSLAGVKAKVLVGSQNPHCAEIQQLAHSLCYETRIDEVDIAAGMQWADLAVCAGGSTCWEMAFMGLPNVILSLAENQIPIAESLEAAGCSIHAGWHETVTEADLTTAIENVLADDAERAKMSRLGCELVDGKGGDRVVAVLEGRNSARTTETTSSAERFA